MHRPIEEQQVVHRLVGRQHEQVTFGERRRETIVGQPRRMPRGVHLAPVMMERHAAGPHPVQAKRVKKAFPLAVPVDEFDAELRRALRRRHHLLLGDADLPEEIADTRHGRLADADGANGAGFDDGDLHRLMFEPTREQRRRHPPGRASANDHDRSQRCAVRCRSKRPVRHTVPLLPVTHTDARHPKTG